MFFYEGAVRAAERAFACGWWKAEEPVCVGQRILDGWHVCSGASVALRCCSACECFACELCGGDFASLQFSGYVIADESADASAHPAFPDKKTGYGTE